MAVSSNNKYATKKSTEATEAVDDIDSSMFNLTAPQPSPAAAADEEINIQHINTNVQDVKSLPQARAPSIRGVRKAELISEDDVDDYSSIKVDSTADKNAPQAHCVTLTVPTKTYDGGSNASKPTTKRLRRQVHKHEDPFMYYSNQETRMNEMLFRRIDEESEPASNNENVVRKTRISFELDPWLLFEDLLIEESEHLSAQDDDDVFRL